MFASLQDAYGIRTLTALPRPASPEPTPTAFAGSPFPRALPKPAVTAVAKAPKLKDADVRAFLATVYRTRGREATLALLPSAVRASLTPASNYSTLAIVAILLALVASAD